MRFERSCSDISADGSCDLAVASPRRRSGRCSRCEARVRAPRCGLGSRLRSSIRSASRDERRRSDFSGESVDQISSVRAGALPVANAVTALDWPTEAAAGSLIGRRRVDVSVRDDVMAGRSAGSITVSTSWARAAANSRASARGVIDACRVEQKSTDGLAEHGPARLPHQRRPFPPSRQRLGEQPRLRALARSRRFLRTKRRGRRATWTGSRNSIEAVVRSKIREPERSAFIASALRGRLY